MNIGSGSTSVSRERTGPAGRLGAPKAPALGMAER